MARFVFPKTAPWSHVQESDWNSWVWQLRNSLKSQADFEKHYSLSDNEKTAFEHGQEVFNIRTTPYYASLCRPSAQDPLRRILMPQKEELLVNQSQWLDPLGERKNNPAPRIIHRYSDRALFLVTDICSVYCRYCTRKHFTGQDQAMIKSDEFDQAIAYIEKTKSLREIILSGGDPLTLSDDQLEKVLSRLRGIDHIEIIRIGTRMPVVCPQRITVDLIQKIRKYKPVFLMTHFNHPRELTFESAAGLELFIDHGIPVMNQMVLLNGVNNHPAVVQALNRRLLYLRVKPYYMFQCDPSEGTDHLRTSVDESLKIQQELWGHLSGLAMPTLSLDIPNGGGKTTLVPQFLQSTEKRKMNSFLQSKNLDRDNSNQKDQTVSVRKFKGWDGVEAEYVDPDPTMTLQPLDAEEYMAEWNEIKSNKN